MPRRRARVRAVLAGLASLAVLAGIVALVAQAALPSGHTASAPPVSPGCVPPKLNVSAALAGEHVTVSPEPDSMDASATTQISFLGVPASELADVNVSGSHSGAHAGRLLPYSQGDGVSFAPSKPFAGGELVSVHAQLREGAKTTPFAWSFTVAVRDDPGSHSAAVGTGTSKSSGPAPAPKEYQSFRSRPELRPPDVTVSPEASAASGGDVFLAPYSGVGQYGPMILDEHGGLVWFKAISPAGARAADFRVQQYEGRPVLTWWQDPLVVGSDHTAGEVIANGAYQTVAVVRAGNGYQPDLHEFEITPQGTGLITIYDAIACNLSAVGGPRDGAVADTLLQEIDLRTGLVMYEWHSLDHVSLRDSYNSAAPTSLAEPYDYFHINSIDVEQDGDLLVSSRNTWAAYDVSAKTGQVRWQLGGRRSSFALGPGAATAWQHDARQQPNGAITFFDNGAFPKVHTQSRAIELTLNEAKMTAALARSYDHRNPLVAGSQGNVQALADGDWMVGWGQAGYVSEANAAGQVLFNAHLPPSWESYRAYVQPWSGRPANPPAVAAFAAPGAQGGASVYASWNGATEVTSWKLLAGASASTLKPVGGAPRSGFETAIAAPGVGAGGYVTVQALDAAGAVIGTSAAVKVAGQG
ncbi:MAG TPA: arylsulfotransferase family protein [Solirubrobacteraceae bacterium]|nr:arylsulfotransferase family protein [Solirubrobacteraceae bacterium]